MSHELISRSADLRQLQDEGYELEVRSNHLLIHSVPYLNSRGVVGRGTLVSDLTLAGDVTTTPGNHVAWFVGEHPCQKDGREIPQIKHTSQSTQLAQDIVVHHSFSNKPAQGYANYHQKMTRYIDIVSIGITQVTNVFQGLSEGFFAMYITGPWNVGEFRRRLPAHVQGRWMTATLPSPDGLTPGTSLAGGSSLAMSRSAVHKDAVWKLIEYLSDPAQQLEFYRLTGDLPAHRAAWEDSSLARDATMRAFARQLNYVSPVPKIPEWEQIAMKLQQYAEIASVGRIPLPEVLAELDREVDIILDKRRWLVHGW